MCRDSKIILNDIHRFNCFCCSATIFKYFPLLTGRLQKSFSFKVPKRQFFFFFFSRIGLSMNLKYSLKKIEKLKNGEIVVVVRKNVNCLYL